MLQIDKVQVIPQIPGITIYGDHQHDNVFYLLPQQPRFRLDENGLPVFKFVKYRLPVTREGGKKAGGFCFFDVEFTVSEAQQAAAVSYLQDQLNQTYARMGRQAPPVKIGTITYTQGKAGLLLESLAGNGLIEKVVNPGGPALYGNLTTPFAVEFSQDGVQVFEGAMQGKGGVVSVFYDILCAAKLPKIKVTANFYAEKFYSFYQTIDVDWNLWSEDSYRETIREQMINSESVHYDFEWGQLTDEKLREKITDWAQRTMEDAIERKMIAAIAPVSADNRKLPEGIENVTRDISERRVESFYLSFDQSMAIDWTPNPRGTLPNITSLTDKQGNPLVWTDFAAEIDANDDFFKTLKVKMRVNADFEELPINSVEVKIDYPKEKPTDEQKEFEFTNPNKIEEYVTYIENSNWKYKYSYTVNYKGESKVFQSAPIETDDNILTVNVDELGLLLIDAEAMGIDFDQVQRAQVTLQYEDKANGVDLIERQFTLTKDNQSHKIRELIFQPMRNPYRYSVRYDMTDGKEYRVVDLKGQSPQLYIGDPFNGKRTVGVRALGSLDTEINTIFVDLKYIDETNRYTQTKAIALSKSNPFLDWSFSVIDENAGKIVYSGTIQYKDGTVEEIKETETTKNTIMVGKKIEDSLEVEVYPDLIDFSEVKLVKIALHYEDPANGVNERKDIIFRQGATNMVPWKVELKNKALASYKRQYTFFLTAGGQKVTAWETTDERSLFPELAAVPV